MAAPPDADGSERASLDDRPPFLTWRAIYALVLGALALQVVVYSVLTLVNR
jgi:hypothetical protein